MARDRPIQGALDSLATYVFNNDWIEKIELDKKCPHLGIDFANCKLRQYLSENFLVVREDTIINKRLSNGQGDSSPGPKTYGSKRDTMCYLLRMIRNYKEHKEHNFRLDDGITCFTTIFPKVLNFFYIND